MSDNIKIIFNKNPTKSLNEEQIQYVPWISEICGYFPDGVEYEEWVNIGLSLTKTYSNSSLEEEAYLAFAKLGTNMPSYSLEKVASTWLECRNNTRHEIPSYYIFNVRDDYFWAEVK